MSHRHWILLTLLSVAVLIAAACGSSAPPAPTAKPAAQPAAAQPAAQAPKTVYKVRMTTSIPNGLENLDEAWAYDQFAKRIKERSGGQLDPQIHWAGSLYDDVNGVKAAIDGAVEVASSSVQNYGTFTTAFFVLDMPFLFRGMDEEVKTVITGPFNKRLKDLLVKDQPNLMPLYIAVNGGLRDLVASKKVVTTADLRGIKIRTTATPIDVATWKTLGALPTPIAWPEVYTSGTQNLIQAFGCATDYWVVGSKNYEWTKYITQVGYQTQIRTVSVSKKFFDSLPANLQKVMTDAAAELQTEHVEVARKYSDKWEKWLATEGKQEIIKLTPQQKQEWADKAKPVYDEFKDKVPAGLVDEFQNHLKTLR